MGEAISAVIAGFAAFVTTMIDAFPDSPFQVDLGAMDTIAGYVAFFLPMSSIMQITAAWLAAVSVWYVGRWAMRVIRQIA